MDTTIDPAAKPLSADELAKDAAASPHDADAPVLKEAQESTTKRGAVDSSVVSDGGAPDDQAEAVDRSLTKLPPG